MKLINILLVTAMLLMLVTAGSARNVSVQMDPDGKSAIESNVGLRIQLDIKPTSFSGSILFERRPEGDDSHRSIALSVAHGADTKSPSIARSIQDRFKAMRILTRVAARLIEKALRTLI